MNAFNETGPSRVDDEVKNLLKTDVPNEVERKLHRRAQAIAETLPENRTWSFDLWPFTRLRWAVASALTLIAAGVVTLILPALLVTSLPSDDVLARTVEAMRNAKTLIWEFDPGHDESEGFLNRRTWMAPNLLRVDITHQDFLNETTWVYEDKVVKFNRLNNHVNIMQNFPGMWEVGSAERTASTGTPGKLIDRLLEGDYRFETAIERDGLTLNRYVRTTNPDRHQYLFDAETFLPVEVRDVSSEYMHGAEVGKRKILTRYHWDVPVSEAFMTPEYPEDAIVNVVDGSIPAPAHTIYPDKGVGPILFGMTRDEVRAIWGEPNDVDLVTPTASYFDHGVTLGFLKYGLVSYSCELQDDSHTTFKTFTGKTVEGIGLGSTEEEVIAALGEPYERNNLRAPDAPPSSTSNLFLYYLFLNYDPPISMNFSMRRTNKSEEILRVTGISVHRR